MLYVNNLAELCKRTMVELLDKHCLVVKVCHIFKPLTVVSLADARGNMDNEQTPTHWFG